MERKIRIVFDIFQQISAIPRCSKQEDNICSWIHQWAIEKGFDSQKDSAGNLLISVPASTGYETKPGISLTLPKKQLEYTSEHLFPFFFNMLSEGTNREVQSKQLKIDEKDFFGLLLATARYDTIGAITVKQIN